MAASFTGVGFSNRSFTSAVWQIQHIFPLTKMVVTAQTIRFTVFWIAKIMPKYIQVGKLCPFSQHILFCTACMYKSAFRYNDGLAPSRRFIPLVNKSVWYLQLLLNTQYSALSISRGRISRRIIPYGCSS